MIEGRCGRIGAGFRTTAAGGSFDSAVEKLSDLLLGLVNTDLRGFEVVSAEFVGKAEKRLFLGRVNLQSPANGWRRALTKRSCCSGFSFIDVYSAMMACRGQQSSTPVAAAALAELDALSVAGDRGRAERT